MKNVIIFITIIFSFCSVINAQIIRPDKPVIQGPTNPSSTQLTNCFNVPINNTSGTWKKTIAVPQNIFFDGFGVGICTKDPLYPLHVNSIAKINTLVTERITANDNVKNGSEIVLYSNTNSGGYGRIDFNSSNGNSNSGYAFLFSNWNGTEYDKHMIIRKNGKITIGDVGKTSGNFKLFVKEGILTERLKIAAHSSIDWPDFVFNTQYQLPLLKDVELFIQNNKHLPNIPSAKEVNENGIDVAEMDAMLLRKIEELTLYAIEQNKRIEELELKIENLEKK